MTRKKKPTSFDVARMANVHRSAVSRALSGTGRVSEETRERVIKAAQELGYRVNYLARGLHNQNSGLVGLVASRLDTPYRALQVKVAARELLAKGYCPLLIVAEGDAALTGLIDRLLNYNVAGMLVTSDSPPADIIDECKRLSVPVVLVNRDVHDAEADRVQLDITASGRLAFDMLRQAGGQSFAVLEPQEKTYTVSGRARVFAECCRAAHLPVTVIEPQRQNYIDGLEAAELFMAQNTPVDAVFCTTDLLALGFLDGMRVRYNWQVPQDLQILGYDDIEQAGWLGNNLSTIRQDAAAAAMLAVDLMQARIEDPDRTFEVATIPISPVWRGTTRYSPI
ncbi:LacI family DNA-binding transcriptional regulator [Phaeobacter sp. B1627]|uniref:LacI family DNA-binding transcriptional regulator n=1 Tax=Phaeobacter sp. B1627 TaxID=2583809 RepID=UPI001118BAA1|nr:LacI family DNA-binding transcriptional regulator [Phaeobacter sp. B1627]TNJ41222.1 LacI family DNA-binding transcriptional regulator [Phaeobacter sp. B1627]